MVSAMDDVSRRRAKQIEALNPGHPREAILRAVQDEAEAIKALARVGPDRRRDARLHLRACQIRSTNLDLSYAEATERARIQLTSDSYGAS